MHESFAQGEPFYQLNQKASEYARQGRYEESLALSRQALELAKKEFGPYHDNVAESLNTLAAIYATQGKYSKAERALKRVLAIRTLAVGEEVSEKNYTDISSAMRSLAKFYSQVRRYARSENFLKRAIKLDFYKQEDLAKIIKNSSKLLSVKIDDAATLEIAKRSRGTPRIANRLLRRVRDYAQVLKIENVDQAAASKILNELGIDQAGFDDLDRKVLKLILESFGGGPVGIESLAASLNEEVDTIEDAVEPYLLMAGYLKRTSRGRIATRKAFEHFGLKFNQEQQEEIF